ncbi:MAG: DNA integrity scanning protein DisA nucleotide-binding domain protein [archaeon]
MILKKKLDMREIYDILLPIAKNIAKSKEGALFIVGSKHKLKRKYELMFPQLVRNYQLTEPGIEKVLVKLATLDGAVVISDAGEILAYGAKLKKSKPLKGFGTKHAAASGTTHQVPDSTAILVSEESNWVKVLKGGEIILEMNGEEYPKAVDQKVLSFLIDKDTALLTDINVSVSKFPKIRRRLPVETPVD